MLRRRLVSLRAICPRARNSWWAVPRSSIVDGSVGSYGKCRLLSSFPFQRDDLPQELEDIRKASHNLIEQENFLTLNQWIAVEHMAPFWLNYVTFESVDVMFRLLDRLEMELRAHYSTSSPPWINEILVEKMVDVWYRVLEDQKEELVVDTPEKSFSLMKTHLKDIFRDDRALMNQKAPEKFTPQQVFSKVRSYLEVFLRVRWTSSIAFKISAAHAYNASGSDVDPTFCEDIIYVTVKEWQKTKSDDVYPTTDLFQTTLLAWSKVGSSSNILKRSFPSQKVDNLLDLMREIGLVPTNENYNTCVTIFADAASVKGARRAQSLVLDSMYANFLSSGDETWSWSSAFSAAIEAWARIDDISTFENIELLIGRYNELRRSGFVHTTDEALLVYNSALHSLSTVGTLEAAQKAQEIVQEIMCFSTPTQDTYVWLVSVLSNAGCFEAARDTLASIHNPPPASYFAVLRAMSDQDHPMLVPQTYEVLRVLSLGLHSGPRANTHVYNQCLASIVGSGYQSSLAWKEKSELVLEIFAFLKTRWLKGDFDRRPDRESYAHVIRCFSLQGDDVFAFHWFDAMLKDYQDGNKSAGLTVTECNHVLVGLLRSDDNDAAAKAQYFLEDIPNIKSTRIPLKPNVESYEIVLSCLSKKGGKDSSNRALKLLESMADSKLEPSSVCFSLVIKSLAESGTPDRAEEVLRNLLCYADAAEPDISLFNSCIQAWAASGRLESSEKCENLVSRMLNLSVNGFTELHPDVDTYVSLIMSYALGKSRDAAYRTEEILKNIHELEKDDVCSSVGQDIYHLLLLAWENSTHPDKARCILSIQDEINLRFDEALETNCKIEMASASSLG